MKRLIVCCDGTWNSDDKTTVPTNVSKLGDYLIQRDDTGIWQRVFYRSGVGARFSSSGAPQEASRLRRALDRIGGGAFGWGLDTNILAIYRELIRAYQPGDQLWFFGFSRGAYTARSLTGLIRNCGILQRKYEVLADKAMDLYRARGSGSHPNAPYSVNFRTKYAHEIKSIHFIGVWDTVGSLGIPQALGPMSALWNRRYRFHDVDLSSRVQHAYHAIAIDEVRRAFAPTIWQWRDKHPDAVSDDEGGRPGSSAPTARNPQTVEQLWFPGVHSDIGGGYEQTGLSDIALEWMIDKARTCGLAFDDERIREELAPNPTGTLHDSRWRIHKLLPFVAVKQRDITAKHRQFIHTSAITRREQVADYDPPNLREAIHAAVPIMPQNPDASPDSCSG